MAGQISESYASPGLRWGLILEDHPGTTFHFELMAGTEIPDVAVPEQYGGRSNFCVATIRFPVESGLADVVAYKSVPSEGTADEWNVLCTKTLGRALKRAGYPDDLHDLKALVLWRQRNAEVAAIAVGGGQLALGSGAEVTAALEAAAVSDPSAVAGDDGETVVADADDDQVRDAMRRADDGLLGTVRDRFAGLSGDEQGQVRGLLRPDGINPIKPATVGEAEAVFAAIAAVQGVVDSTGEIVDAVIVSDDPPEDEWPEGTADIIELTAGFEGKDRKLWVGFLATMTLGADAHPATWSDKQRSAALDWLDESPAGDES